MGRGACLPIALVWRTGRQFVIGLSPSAGGPSGPCRRGGAAECQRSAHVAPAWRRTVHRGIFYGIMKLLLVFAFMLGEVVAEPVFRTWTSLELLHYDIDNIIEPYLKDFIINATNTLMEAFWLYEVKPSTHALLRSPSGKTTWSPEEVLKTVNDTNIKTELRIPALNIAAKEVKKSLESGTKLVSIEVNVPVLDLSTWILSDLDDAIESKKFTYSYTESLPYLEKARKELKEQKRVKVYLITPYGLLKSQSGHTELIPKKIYQ